MLSMCFIPCWQFSDFFLLCLFWSFHWVLNCAYNYQVVTALRRTLNKIWRRQVYTASLPLSSTTTWTEVVCISKQMSLWLTNRCITVLVSFAKHESYFCACKWCFQLLLLFFFFEEALNFQITLQIHIKESGFDLEHWGSCFSLSLSQSLIWGHLVLPVNLMDREQQRKVLSTVALWM